MRLGALIALEPHRQRRLEQALRTGRLTHPFSSALLDDVVGAADAEAIRSELAILHGRGITGPAVAAVVEVAREQARTVDRPLLVWTGPTVPGLFARDTREVFVELLRQAYDRIWLSTYAMYNGQQMLKPLAERMDDEPGLEVTLLLNIGRPYGNTTTAEDLVAKFSHDLWTQQWPGTRRPSVFYDPRSVLPQSQGVLHTKALVVDERAAFVGSANLTEAAFERNFEAGILSRDPALAGSLARHFRALVDHGKVLPLP